jgi:hypothetical protein
MCRTSIALVLALTALGGCSLGKYPNPNDPDPDITFDGEALQNEVRQVDESLRERVVRGMIDEQEKTRLIQDYVKEKLAGVDTAKIPDNQVWRYADLYRLMGDWDTTDKLYERAVKVAPNEDRRVNDTLRLAEAKARLKDVPAGIKLVRSTFDANPGGKAPILMATLYEFAPAALGQGHDLEVAQLLEDSMAQHLQTYVDPKTDVGRAFLTARRHHIKTGWDLVLHIYQEAGDPAAMRSAIERQDQMMRRFAST